MEAINLSLFDAREIKNYLDSIKQYIVYLDTCSVGKTDDFQHALYYMMHYCDSAIALLKK